MKVDNSKLIVFALVAVSAFGFQMYKDNMSQINLRLNIENSLLFGLLVIMFLMVYDQISTVVEGIENTDTTSSSTTDTTSSSTTDTTDTTSFSTTDTTDITSSSTTEQLVNNSVMTSQTLGSPVSAPSSSNTSMETNTAPQPTPTDILNAPMSTSPTGQPTTIQNTEIDRSMNNTSNIMSAVETDTMVPNSALLSEPAIKVKVESEDSDEEDIEVDISVNGDMMKLQKNVKGQLNKLVDEDNKSEGHKYVLSDPAHWVNENEYKVNIIPKCQVCPVVMCDQNFMSV